MTSYEDTFYKGKLPSKKCLFCTPHAGMAVFETDNFRLLADTYPIITGHLMISSKDHYGSAGEVPLHLRAELVHLKATAAEIARKMDNSCIFYEHGKAGSCHASSSEEIHCEHFHLHCLPASICIHAKIEQEFSGLKLDTYEDIFSCYDKYGSYLFFENCDGKMIYYPAEQNKVPPHFLRTLICKEFGLDALSDWQAYLDLDGSIISRNKIAVATEENVAYALF